MFDFSIQDSIWCEWAVGYLGRCEGKLSILFSDLIQSYLDAHVRVNV